jgi:hypothetical protein
LYITFVVIFVIIVIYHLLMIFFNVQLCILL